MDKYKPPQQNELYVRAYNFIFNSHVIEKIKWYQTGLFKALLVIAAVVVMFYSGMEFISELIVVSAGGAYAVMMFIMKKIVVSIAVSIGFKLFVKVAGPEFAFIAAIAAAVAGFFGQNIAGMTPTNMLQMAGAMFKGISSFLQDAFQDLKQEMDSFLSLKTEQEKALEKAADLLNDEVTPYAALIIGETPEQFLYRTTVFVGSGFTELNSVSSYTDRALQLPTTPYSMKF